MNEIWRAVLFTWRSATHQRHRLVTSLIIVIIALGIGTATAVFSIVDSLLIRELPFPAAAELVSVELTTIGDHNRSLFGRSANVTLFEAWRKQVVEEIDIAGFQSATATVSGDWPARTVPIVGVTFNTIGLLGVRPLMGRSFVESDDARGAAPCAILSYALWEQLFADNTAVAEKHIAVDGRPYQIIGVMPRSFRVPLSIPESEQRAAEMWIPLNAFRELTSLSDDPTMPLEIIGRIQSRSSIASVEGKLGAVAKSVTMGTEAGHEQSTVAQVNKLQRIVVRSVQTPLLLVSGAVGLLLFLTCLNVANLLMARTLARDRELAVRIAIGASRGRLAAQLIAESVAISLFGGLLGVGLALVALPELTNLGSSYLGDIQSVAINIRVLMFSLGLAVISGAAFGAWPTLMALSRAPLEAMSSRTNGGRRFTRHWMRALIVLEVAFAVVVLTTMGLLARSFARLTNVDRGYNIEHTVVAGLVLPDRDYPTTNAQRTFTVRLLSELKRQSSAVSDVAVSSGIPILGGTTGIVSSGDRARGTNAKRVALWSVSGNYFSGLGIPILRGREPDFAANPNGVAIDMTAARLIFGNENALGQRIAWANGTKEGVVNAVVGDIQDLYLNGDSNARYRSFRPHVYVSASSNVSPIVRISARVQGDPRRALKIIKETIANIDRNLPIDVLDTMNGMARLQLARERFLIVIMTLFAAMAGMLAGAGIFAVMTHSTAERRHEIGVRLAMGARPSGIVLLILGDALILTGAGATIGIIGSLSFGRVLRSVLFETAPFDAATMIAVVVVTVTLSLIASALPARRAARVDAAAVLLGGR